MQVYYIQVIEMKRTSSHRLQSREVQNANAKSSGNNINDLFDEYVGQELICTKSLGLLNYVF